MPPAEPETVPRRFRRCAALALAALALLPAGAEAVEAWRFLGPHGYTITAHFPLDRKVHGVDGALEMMIDGRIPGPLRREYEQMYWFGTTAVPAVERSVLGQWLIPAQLRIVDRGGDTVAELPLTSPFANLLPVALTSTRSDEFLVLVHQGGFGSFNGTLGVAMAVVDGRIRPLRAIDTLTGEELPVELQHAGTSDWRILPGPAGAEILQLSCTPDDVSEEGFREIYGLYRFTRGAWTYETRLDRGYCTWHGEFPPRELFP